MKIRFGSGSRYEDKVLDQDPDMKVRFWFWIKIKKDWSRFWI